MNKRIDYFLAAALFSPGLMLGGRSLTPVEATKLAGDDTRTLINEYVADELRAKQLIALVDQLERDLMAYAKVRAAHNEGLRRKNAGFDASREDMEHMYDTYNTNTRTIGMSLLRRIWQ